MLLSIAVDGPAGSGKSTVAKAVADALHITYLDTGAMYRMVTLNIIRESIDLKDIDRIQKLLDNIVIEFRSDGLYLNGENVTEEIRNNVVANAVSGVAAIGIIRTKMVAMQQEIAKGQSIIMDGRDIGTHVLVNASHKFYLVASVEERAKRRMRDFQAQNIHMTLEELIRDIESRDEQDMNRDISPLRQAEDAILVDTTSMTIDEVIEYIIQEVRS
ncbi:MAG: (d)CMP kinase [Clostridiales bacterium]|nr:(d)CMP kinase [Clostridiales bacterium]